MTKFTVGIYARLAEHYDYAKNKTVEEIQYKLHDWADEHGIAFYRKEGEVLVCTREIEFDENEKLTREQVVMGMVAGLHEKQTELRAAAQMELNAIDEQINKLLAITDQSVEELPSDTVFAPYPRKPAQDATDTEFDDIPF
jgi:hypothetical protein